MDDMGRRDGPGNGARRSPGFPPLAQEVKATTVLGMPIREASSKVRMGPPSDDDEHYALPIWAGVIPVRTEVLDPVPDPRNLDGFEPPAHILNSDVG